MSSWLENESTAKKYQLKSMTTLASILSISLLYYFDTFTLAIFLPSWILRCNTWLTKSPWKIQERMVLEMVYKKSGLETVTRSWHSRGFIHGINWVEWRFWYLTIELQSPQKGFRIIFRPEVSHFFNLQFKRIILLETKNKNVDGKYTKRVVVHSRPPESFQTEMGKKGFVGIFFVTLYLR